MAVVDIAFSDKAGWRKYVSREHKSLEYTRKKVVISRHSWISKKQRQGLAEAKQQYSIGTQNAVGLG